MKILIYLILGALVTAIFRTKSSVDRCQTPQERSFMIRTTATFWLMGFVFLMALLFLPNKARVLMMLPAFFLVVTGARAWQNSRERLRRKESEKVDIEKMKRVN